MASLEGGSIWELALSKDSDNKEEFRSQDFCDLAWEVTDHHFHCIILSVQDQPCPVCKRTLQGHDNKRKDHWRYLGYLAIALETLHQDVELFFDQLESGPTYDCSDQLNTVEVRQCRFQVKSLLKRLAVLISCHLVS